MSRGGVSPARRCAFAVVRRTFEDGAYADRALEAEARRARLGPRDRALATRLAFEAIQRRATLDHLIAVLADRPPEQLDADTRAALRLGLVQLCFLDGVAAHAAVDESVELVKAGRARGGHRLVNAVLRRATREAPGLLEGLDDATPRSAAIRHSHPEWVAQMWWQSLGAAQARQLMESGNHPAESAVRANTLITTAAEVAGELDALGVASHPAPALPEGLVLDAPFDVVGSQAWREGRLTAQSRASMLVARVVAPRPGERVLDLCAAPGAKATHIAALMEGRGSVVAVEQRAARARALAANSQRMGADNVEVRTADARDDHGTGFDRVLVDAPCTGLGTLRSRPDLRWRAAPGSLDELVRLQGEILSSAARSLRPGGTLVYSTCTISPRENEGQMATLLDAHPELEVEDLQSDFSLWKHPAVADHLQLMPHRDATDGFFIARLRRREGRS